MAPIVIDLTTPPPSPKPYLGKRKAVDQGSPTCIDLLSEDSDDEQQWEGTYVMQLRAEIREVFRQRNALGLSGGQRNGVSLQVPKVALNFIFQI